MARYRIPAVVVTACLAAPLLFAQPAQPAQETQAPQTSTAPSSDTAVPAQATPTTEAEAKAEKKAEKNAQKAAKKKAKKKGPEDVLPPGMVAGHMISSVPAIKPHMAVKAHISGTVTLLATIETDGSIKHVKVVDGPPMLQQAAIDAVTQWKYTPYMLNGQPAVGHTTIQIRFK
ncbi:MAG: energy transducer TonB [Bryocella sp.]